MFTNFDNLKSMTADQLEQVRLRWLKEAEPLLLRLANGLFEIGSRERHYGRNEISQKCGATLVLMIEGDSVYTNCATAPVVLQSWWIRVTENKATVVLVKVAKLGNEPFQIIATQDSVAHPGSEWIEQVEKIVDLAEHELLHRETAKQNANRIRLLKLLGA